MKKTILLFTFILLLSGCGGGSTTKTSSSASSDASASKGSKPAKEEEKPSVSSDIKMKRYTVYAVQHGNTLVKHSEETRVIVTFNEETNLTTVQLIEGNATIIRE